MHVDGGVSSQIFALPGRGAVDASRLRRAPGRDASLWLLVNYVIGPRDSRSRPRRDRRRGPAGLRHRSSSRT
jgi:hypothetical protein